MRQVLVPVLMLVAGVISLFAAQETNVEEKRSALPPRAFRRFGTTQFRHGSRIQCLQFSPRGNELLASGGNDPVRLWNTDTGNLIREFNDPWILAVAWHPKEPRFVTAGAFRLIRGWSLSSPLEDFKIEAAPTGVRCIAYAPDGSYLVAGCQAGQVLQIRPANKNSINLPSSLKSEVNAVAVSPDGNWIASAGADRIIQLFNKSGDTFGRGPELKSPGMINALAFTPDGRGLLSAGDDRKIRLWSVPSWKEEHALAGHKDSIISLALSRDGKRLVSGSYDQTLGVWDLESRSLVRTIPRRFGDSDALAIRGDGKVIATAGLNNTIRLFDADRGVDMTPGVGPQAGLVRVVTSAGLDSLFALSAAGELIQWNTSSGRVVRNWQTKTTPLLQQEFFLTKVSDEPLLLLGASGEEQLDLWNGAAGKLAGTLPLGADRNLAAIATAPDGNRAALGLPSGTIQILDWPSRQVKHTVHYPGRLSTLAFNHQGAVLAAAGSAGKVVLWDTATGQELRRFKGNEEAPENQQPGIAHLAFSPDTRTLVLAGFDGVIRLVDWSTGRAIATCEGHTSAIAQIAFAPDGRSFASASHDKTVRLWETFIGQPIATFKGHEGPVLGVAFSADGRTLYSASSDTTALAWDVTGMSVDGKLSQSPANAAQLQGAWQELAVDDVGKGHLAVWRLVASRESVQFLGQQVYLVDPKKVDQLFRDLSSDNFPVREKATQELEKYGRWMEGRLLAALEDPPTLEVRRRLERMLNILKVAGAMTLKQERLRMYRTMTVLEQVGTAEARKVLEDLTRGAPEIELQREAELSLLRLQKRNGST